MTKDLPASIRFYYDEAIEIVEEIYNEFVPKLRGRKKWGTILKLNLLKSDIETLTFKHLYQLLPGQPPDTSDTFRRRG